jgi:3-phosphoshikimate 1-carboxyvinyltransferase
LLSAQGRVRLPGSKSISNRVLLLAALAEGRTELRDLLEVRRYGAHARRAADARRRCRARADNAVCISGGGGIFPVVTPISFSATPAPLSGP